MSIPWFHCLCDIFFCQDICEVCFRNPQETIGNFLSKIHRTEKRLQNIQRICSSCSAIPQVEPVRCESLDCPWLYERKKVENKAEGLNLIHELLEEFIQLQVEDESTGNATEISDGDDVSGGSSPFLVPFQKSKNLITDLYL